MSSIGSEEAMLGLTDARERILVSVRLRPLNSKERARNDASDWECISDTTLICRNNLSASDKSLYPTVYTFDRVFRPDSPTSQVYEEGAKKVALSVVSGINTSVFAYGQTSSGKTFTMGGITEYTVADIYRYVNQHKEREFILKLSAIEIYNECVRDLLSLDSTPLRLLDDPERGTIVEKLTEETLSDWNHFIELLSFSKTQRQVGETSLNEASSRSHQILRLTIESSAREFQVNDESSSLAASVNFVDLAGSERASQTLSAGTRLKEGCHINRSLLTLGTVIRKLSKGRNGHIPFRDSKLTRILQSSLGGNARTAIICTISPARSHVEQTRNTLLFASCAKEVTTYAQVNVLMSDKALIKQLQREVVRLESELKKSHSARFTPDSAALLKEKDLEIEKLKNKVAELTMQRDLTQSQIKNMLQMGGDDMSSPKLESLDPHYPKLRVRNSWDFDNKAPETPNLSIFQYTDSVIPFEASPFSDGYSLSSDDNWFQLADFELYTPRVNSSLMVAVTDFDVERSDLNSKNMEEESLEDSRIGDMYSKSEDNTFTDSNPAEASPNPYSDSNASSPGANIATLGVSQVDHRDEGDLDLVSPALSITATSRSLKMARSRSCKASLMTNRSSFWFEKEEMIDHTPRTAIEGNFTGRPEGHAQQLKYSNNAEMLPRNGSGNSVVSTSVDLQNFKSSADNGSVREGPSATESKEKEEVNHEELNLLADHEARETRLGCIIPASSKNFGLDPTQCGDQGHLDWPSEFNRLLKEIIELWHACNVSLYHRTYFFLLIKGDPSDSIYMEVEHRRLSYLMQTFSQDKKKGENGRTVTLASSGRNVRREREMLSKQIKRRLTREERHNVYLKWGIRLSSRKRRLHLAHRLWSETQNMDHIRESASLVAKLLGVVQPHHTLKDLFALHSAPPHSSFTCPTPINHIL